MSKLHSLVFGPFQENTYLLADEKKRCWIIDPGCYTDAERTILKQYIADHQLEPVKLINTHGHLDHVFGNKFVVDTYSLIPVIHPEEKEMLDYAPVAGLMYDLPFDHYEGELAFTHEGDVWEFDNQEIKIIHTPGHSRGSISLYNEKGGWLISGDVLFKGGIGRTDLPGGNLETLLTTIRKKLMVLPDETIVYSGHGPITTIENERSTNMFIK